MGQYLSCPEVFLGDTEVLVVQREGLYWFWKKRKTVLIGHQLRFLSSWFVLWGCRWYKVGVEREKRATCYTVSRGFGDGEHATLNMIWSLRAFGKKTWEELALFWWYSESSCVEVIGVQTTQEKSRKTIPVFVVVFRVLGAPLESGKLALEVERWAGFIWRARDGVHFETLWRRRAQISHVKWWEFFRLPDNMVSWCRRFCGTAKHRVLSFWKANRQRQTWLVLCHVFGNMNWLFRVLE